MSDYSGKAVRDELIKRHLRRLAFIGLQQPAQEEWRRRQEIQWQKAQERQQTQPLSPPPKNYPFPRAIQEEQRRAEMEREQGAIMSRVKATTLEKRQAEQKAIELQKQANERARFLQQKIFDELFAPTASQESKTDFAFPPDTSRGDNVGRLGVLQAQIRRCIAWTDSVVGKTTATVVTQINATREEARRKTLKENAQATLNSLNTYSLILKQVLAVVEKAQADVLRAYGPQPQKQEEDNVAALNALSSHVDAIFSTIALAVRAIFQRPSIDRAFLDHVVVGEQELKMLPPSQYPPNMYFCQSEIFMFQFMQRSASLLKELLAVTPQASPYYNVVKESSEKAKKAVSQYNQLKKTVLEPQFCSVSYRKQTRTCQQK